MKPFTQVHLSNSILNITLSAQTLLLMLSRTDLTNLSKKLLNNWENLLLKAAQGEEYKDELGFVIDQYGDNFTSSLTTQLEILTSACSSSSEKPTVATIKEHIVSLSPAQRVLISEVCTVLKLITVMPATNAISERSASVLRRVKTYLRSTMSQLHLNNLLMLHAHTDKTDELVIPICLNEFIQGNEHRMSVFGKFTERP